MSSTSFVASRAGGGDGCIYRSILNEAFNPFEHADILVGRFAGKG
jgi:hypothetical protein